MSPEQVQGLPLDNRSDLFSLGIILYQTLTGKLPFLAESAVEVATKIVMETPVSPSQARSDWAYPPEFEKIVLKLLNKNRDDRYAHALEVKQALEECLADLKERRDAALDFSPDELADIVGPQDQVESGTDTVRLDDDMVSELLSGLSESEKQVLSGDQHPVLEDVSHDAETKPTKDTSQPSNPESDQLVGGHASDTPKADSTDTPKKPNHAETIELSGAAYKEQSSALKSIGALILIAAIGALAYSFLVN